MKIALLLTSVVALFIAYIISTLQAAAIQENTLLPDSSYIKPFKPMEWEDWISVTNNGPRFSRVNLNGYTEMECVASGNPIPNVKWFHKGKAVSQMILDINIMNNIQLGVVKSILTIDCAAPPNEGTYFCVAESGTRVAFSDFTELSIDGNFTNIYLEEICTKVISKPPRILTWSPSNMGTIDYDTLLPCAASGNPAPQIYWIDNYGNIITENSKNTTRYKQLKSGYLLISKLVWEDMGYYICVAENSLGRDSKISFVYPLSKG